MKIWLKKWVLQFRPLFKTAITILEILAHIQLLYLPWFFVDCSIFGCDSIGCGMSAFATNSSERFSNHTIWIKDNNVSTPIQDLKDNGYVCHKTYILQ